MDHNSMINGDLVKEILRYSADEAIRLFGATETQLEREDLVKVVKKIDGLV